MGKTEETLQLEKSIFRATKKTGVFGCFEVTIGFFGKERVDYMTYDTKGIFRCYEIKTSVSDFRSKSKNTFCGHYNYYVLTKEVYEKVKDEIPKHVGVFVNGCFYKKPIKQKLGVSETILKNSMIRSLCRESDKLFLNSSKKELEKTKRALEKEKQEVKKLKKEIANLKKGAK